MESLRKAAFLDRDGVINVDHGYVGRLQDFEFIPGAIEAMRLLKKANFALVIVTNQSGIAHGYYTEDQYQALTIEMKRNLAEAGTPIDMIYHCPHHPLGVVAGYDLICDCCKPAPGMIIRAARELNLSLPNSILIGDRPSDIQAARAAGIGKAFILSSECLKPIPGLGGADASYADLFSCVAELYGS